MTLGKKIITRKRNRPNKVQNWSTPKRISINFCSADGCMKHTFGFLCREHWNKVPNVLKTKVLSLMKRESLVVARSSTGRIQRPSNDKSYLEAKLEAIKAV